LGVLELNTWTFRRPCSRSSPPGRQSIWVPPILYPSTDFIGSSHEKACGTTSPSLRPLNISAALSRLLSGLWPHPPICRPYSQPPKAAAFREPGPPGPPAVEQAPGASGGGLLTHAQNLRNLFSPRAIIRYHGRCCKKDRHPGCSYRGDRAGPLRDEGAG
jgi:hypothetical protein